MAMLAVHVCQQTHERSAKLATTPAFFAEPTISPTQCLHELSLDNKLERTSGQIVLTILTPSKKIWRDRSVYFRPDVLIGTSIAAKTLHNPGRHCPSSRTLQLGRLCTKVHSALPDKAVGRCRTRCAPLAERNADHG